MLGLLSENAQIRIPNNIDRCIDCLEPGDIILSAIIPETTVAKIQIVQTTVIGITKMLCDHFRIVNNELIANDYQLILVNNGWYRVSELLAGSRLNCSGNNIAQVISDQAEKIVDHDIIELDKFNKQIDNVMYTLILHPHKTFFADRFIVKGE